MLSYFLRIFAGCNTLSRLIPCLDPNAFVVNIIFAIWQVGMDAKCSAAGVDAAVAKQLLASLDYDRVRREGKASTVLTVSEVSVTVELGNDYFFDAREAVRTCGLEELKWAL